MSTINVGDLKEIRALSAALNVSPDRLMQAIQVVGPSVYPVIRYLNKQGAAPAVPTFRNVVNPARATPVTPLAARKPPSR